MMRILLVLSGGFAIAVGAVAAWSLTQAGVSRPLPVRDIADRPQPVANPDAYGEMPVLAPQFRTGNAYPERPIVDLADTVIRPGAKEALALVMLSSPSPATVIAYVRCSAGIGLRPATERVHAVIFRPGDSLRATVACPIASARPGQSIVFRQAYEPDGGKRGRAQASATVSQTDAPTLPVTDGFRAPYAFSPLGQLIYEANATTILFDDKGGPGIWSTALAHGRSQPANQETGYYGTVAMGAVEAIDNAILLRTRRLEKPVDAKDGRPPYPFQAAILSAHKARDMEFIYGSVEWDVKMPDRIGTWPGLWLLPRHGWPPEIDVYEGFSHHPEWTLASSLSTTIHGGTRSKRAFRRSAFRIQMGDFGLPNTLTSSYHKFQVTVDPAWITMFVDGVETTRYANPFPGTQWHPLMQVAVKAAPDSPYSQGTGDMALRSIKIWRSQ